MTFSIAEMFLLAWAIVATLGYGFSRSELKHHRMVTCDLLVKIAKGKMKVTETDDFIEFKEVE
jgi:hypothetical protein